MEVSRQTEPRCDFKIIERLDAGLVAYFKLRRQTKPKILAEIIVVEADAEYVIWAIGNDPIASKTTDNRRSNRIGVAVGYRCSEVCSKPASRM